MNIASIDIGTNTLLLLVAETENKEINRIITDEHKIARLGEGLDKNGFISDNAISRATTILENYKSILKEYNVSKVLISATSAMRDANNGNEVKEKLESVIEYPINIIEGLEEAKISFMGSVERKDLTNDIVLDIGGGSTEVILGNRNEILKSSSLQIGAVRLTERYFPDFESKTNNYNEASEFVRNELSKLGSLNCEGDMIAVAGTPTTIAAIDLQLPQYNAHLIHNHRINIDRLDEIVEIFKKSSKDELIEKYNVHANRADVILGGAVILLEFLKYIQKEDFLVSCKGLRYGLLKELIKNN